VWVKKGKWHGGLDLVCVPKTSHKVKRRLFVVKSSRSKKKLDKSFLLVSLKQLLQVLVAVEVLFITYGSCGLKWGLGRGIAFCLFVIKNRFRSFNDAFNVGL
jgi:hypothetical protein